MASVLEGLIADMKASGEKLTEAVDRAVGHLAHAQSQVPTDEHIEELQAVHAAMKAALGRLEATPPTPAPVASYEPPAEGKSVTYEPIPEPTTAPVA